MKLLHSRHHRRLLGLAAAVLFGGGVASAQYTGIGTTAPAAGLHITVPVNADTTTTTATVGDAENYNVLQVEELRRTAEYDEATYSAFMVIDPSTGIVRQRDINELLNSSGEWVFNTATNTIEPRRFGAAMDIDGSSVVVGVATTINGNTDITGTFDVTGNSSLDGTLGVTGNADFDADVNVDGNLDIGTVAQVTAANVASTDRILMQDVDDANADRVRYVTVEDLISNASYWDWDGTTLTPADATTAGDINITDGDVEINATLDVNGNTDVTGTFDVTGNSTLDGTLNVTGNSDFDANVNVDGTLDVTGATDLASTLDIGSVAQVTAANVASADRILMQDVDDANADQVRYVTVEDLISNASYWDWDGTTLTPADATTAGDINITDGDVEINATLDVNGNTDVTGTFDVTGNSTITGTFDVTGNSSVTGTLLVDAGADGITLEDLVAVTDVTTQGSTYDATTNPDDFYDRVLITDEAGIVRYIDADDLVANAAEWVWEDADASGGWNAGDAVYLRRNGITGDGDDVYVDFAGNMVVSSGKAVQFGSANDQILATNGGSFATTASGTYDVNAQESISFTSANAGASFTTAAANDVVFTETGAGVPWLQYDADAGGATEAGRVGINTATPAATLHVAGNFVATNATVTSDARFKRDVQAFSNALATVKQLRGVTYRFRGEEFPMENFDDAEHVGFLAQEIREVVPQAVTERADGYLTVDYGAMTPVLAEAVKELAAKVEALEAENAALRGGSVATDAVGAVSTKQFEALEARLAEVSARLEAVAGRK